MYLFHFFSQLYVRETTIRDFPRFPHRGILVDTARHYIHKDVLKQMMVSENRVPHNWLQTLVLTASLA